MENDNIVELVDKSIDKATTISNVVQPFIAHVEKPGQKATSKQVKRTQKIESGPDNKRNKCEDMKSVKIETGVITRAATRAKFDSPFGDMQHQDTVVMDKEKILGHTDKGTQLKEKDNNGGVSCDLKEEREEVLADSSEEMTSSDEEGANEVKEQMTFRISISNVSLEATNKDLELFFKDYDCLDSWFYSGFDRVGADFSTLEKAQLMLRLSGTEWLGNKITVTYRGQR